MLFRSWTNVALVARLGDKQDHRDHRDAKRDRHKPEAPPPTGSLALNDIFGITSESDRSFEKQIEARPTAVDDGSDVDTAEQVDTVSFHSDLKRIDVRTRSKRSPRSHYEGTVSFQIGPASRSSSHSEALRSGSGSEASSMCIAKVLTVS